MDLAISLIVSILSTVKDVLPIAIIIFGMQFFVIRRPIPNVKRVIIGFVAVIVGLAFFLVGLERALFPLGKLMATQLTDPDFILGTMSQAGHILQWQDY